MADKSKAQQKIDDAVGTINSAIAILDNIPELNDSNYTLSLSLNPFDLLMMVLRKIVSYDEIVEFVSKLLVLELPIMETAVKTYLLTHLKLLFTCSMNPLITHDLILNGVVFDLKTIDLMNTLRYCPLDPKNEKGENMYGRYYYFGCDEMEIPDDLKYSVDFNSFLWYAVNRRRGDREVWYGYKRNPKYEEDGVKVHRSLPEKQTKKNGIITLEYNGRSSNLSNAEGNGMNIQTPFNNCIHVFIGNTAPYDIDEVNFLYEDINAKDYKLADYEEVKAKAHQYILRLENELIDLGYSVGEEDPEEGLDSEENIQRKQMIDADLRRLRLIRQTLAEKTAALQDVLSTDIDNNIIVLNRATNVWIYNISSLNEELTIPNACMTQPVSDVESEKKVTMDEISGYTSQPTLQYRRVEDNYYYHRTLFEFNTDYIMSLKLFDAKTLAAQLLDALSGCLTMNLNLSFEEIVIKNEVERMVHDILDTDDTVINDCFYSFDNNAYNQMLENARLERMGVSVFRDGTYNGQISAEDVMNQLNNISANATHEQIQSAISSALYDVSRQVKGEYDNYDTKVGFGFDANFINDLLNTLSYVLVLSVLSPKLYLLMAVNLKIMGQEAGFDLAGFLESFKQMIAGIIRAVRDELMRMFKEWLMSLIAKLAKDVSAKIALEQILYYKQLLQQCIECFRLHGATADWNMADVDYSDIYETENNEPVNDEC